MSKRKDLLDAINHRQPEKVPIDLGSSSVTGIHVLCLERLREYCGLEKRPIIVIDAYEMLGLVEDDIKEALGIGVSAVRPPISRYGFPNLEPYKTYKTLWGQEVLVPEKFNTVRGKDGAEYIFPCGDTTVAPCARMVRGSFFFDALNRQPCLDENRLDYHDNLEEFGPISQDSLNHIHEETTRLIKRDTGVLYGLSGTSLGNISQVPGLSLKNPRGIRDISEWYISTLIRQDYIHEVFAAQTEIAVKNLKRIWETAGSAIDVVTVCGTDFGTQNSQFCSPGTFEELYMPYFKKINGWIHDNTTWKTFKHSCGAIVPLLPLIIEAGFDIINPVQCSASGMDPLFLKKAYGKQLVFWGGGVNTQQTLPFGTPDEVAEEVLHRCEIFSKDGGYVFNAIHNIQADTPVENVAAMFKAVREFNGGVY